MQEIRTLRAMRRGLETAYGAANEALPKETGSQRLGCTYGDQRQSSTLPDGWLFNLRTRRQSVAQYGRSYKVSLRGAESRESETVLGAQAASYFGGKQQLG